MAFFIILSNIYCGCKDTCVVISTNDPIHVPSYVPWDNTIEQTRPAAAAAPASGKHGDVLRTATATRGSFCSLGSTQGD